MAGWDRQVFEHVLLGFLVEKPAHGYELAAQFEADDDLSGIAQLGRSQLYDLLNALEKRAAAVSTLQEESGGPARKVFSVTDSGREQFFAWLGRPVVSIRSLRIEFVFKLYFYRRLDLPGAVDLLRAQTAVLEGRLSELQASQPARIGISADVCGLQQRLLNAALEWLAAGRNAVGETEGSPQ